MIVERFYMVRCTFTVRTTPCKYTSKIQRTLGGTFEGNMPALLMEIDRSFVRYVCIKRLRASWQDKVLVRSTDKRAKERSVLYQPLSPVTSFSSEELPRVKEIPKRATSEGSRSYKADRSKETTSLAADCRKIAFPHYDEIKVLVLHCSSKPSPLATVRLSLNPQSSFSLNTTFCLRTSPRDRI